MSKKLPFAAERHHENQIRRFCTIGEWSAAHPPKLKNTLVVCFSNRSGSNLLSHWLKNLSNFPLAREYFNYEYVLQHFLAFGSDTYVDFLCRQADRYAQQGNYSTKANLSQLCFHLEIGAFENLFLNPRFVWCRRRDLILQAVSFYLADSSKIWAVRSPEDRSKALKEVSSIPYDREAILERLMQIVRQESGFAALFQSMNASPATVYYEDLCRNARGITEKVLELLGLPILPVAAVQEPPLQKQATEQNRIYAERFRNEMRSEIGILMSDSSLFPPAGEADIRSGDASGAPVPGAGPSTQKIGTVLWQGTEISPSGKASVPITSSESMKVPSLPTKQSSPQSTFIASFGRRVLGHLSRRLSYHRYGRLLSRSGLFDGNYYLAQNADVQASGVDPLFHYFMHGAAEGRRPSAGFDPIYYVGAYPDVARSACNPLLHYLLLGKAQGLLPLKAQPPAHEPEVVSSTLPETASAPLPVTPRDEWPEADCSALVSLLSSRSFVVVLSHDDYTSQTGGVQLYLSDEEEAFTKAGVAYFQLFPFPKPPKASATDGWSEVVGLHVDGRKFGKTSAASLLAGLEKIRGANPDGCRSMIVHHLLGWGIDWVTKAHSALGSAPAYYWMHDHFAVCRQYTLMRNSVRFCEAPAPETHACEICAYGGARRTKHLASMKSFFQALTPTVVFPSGTPRKFWSSTFGDLPLRLLEIPHLEKVSNGSEPAAERISNSSRLRIGYLGAEHSMIKGWGTWRFLVDRCEALDGKYEFFRLGTGTAHGHETHVPVAATKHNRDAMMAALKDQKIDLVLLWSLCPETFSFTLHESLAAGCFVVTYVNSGNIRHTVEAEGCGKVFASEEDLVEWLSDEDAVRKEIEAVRARSGGAPVFRRRLFAAEELLQETKSP